MEEKDPSMDLPPEIACLHRKWNVRAMAYRTLIVLFQKLPHSSDEWELYRNVLPNIAADSFPPVREQALEVVLHYVQRCDSAQETSTEVIHKLIDTIPTNAKPRAKHLLEQIILQYVEIGCARDVVDELLKTALISQVPDVATTCIETITKILTVFGPTPLDLANVLETLPYLQEIEDLKFRSAIKALILEIYHWLGPENIKNVGQILNPVDMKDVMKRYNDAKQNTKLKPIRFVKKKNQRGDDPYRSDNPSSDQETNLLKQINDDFLRKLESHEWTERRDALVELRNIVENSFRLQAGNYDTLLTALKKIIMEDQCVIVVGLAIASVTGIAKGLQHQFSPYAVGICRILLEKFVEKRQNITDQLRKALDVLTTTTSFESLVRPINSFLDNKNPTVRFEAIQLLSRMFMKSTRRTLRKPEFSVLYKSLVACLRHGQLIIREKSFIALAVALQVAGEDVIMPFLDNVDPMTKARIKSYNLERDFEEKYNEIRYRNVARKDLSKIEDKTNFSKDSSSDFNLKEIEKLDNNLNEVGLEMGSMNGTQGQPDMTNPIRQMTKSDGKGQNQTTFNYNKVTKSWSSSNSNVTLERCCVNLESRKPTVNISTPHRENRKREKPKKYPFKISRKIQRKETSRVYSKGNSKKGVFVSYQKKDKNKKTLEDVFETSHQIDDDQSIRLTNLCNNPTKLQSEYVNGDIIIESPYQKEGPEKGNITFKTGTCLDISTSTSRAIDMKNVTPISSTQESTDVSHQPQQSTQSLEPSKYSEGFIVLTESEVKKLLGLKKTSSLSDDSCSVLHDWVSKKNLLKRSYKIFQVAKSATDRGSQTSSITKVDSSSVGIIPEAGTIDLIKIAEVIPTQTNGVGKEEKGTYARRIKKYSRGTQWMQHAQAEIRNRNTKEKAKILGNNWSTMAWSSKEMSKDSQECSHEMAHRSHKSKKTPRKIKSVYKRIEYRQPSQKDIRRKWTVSDRMLTRTNTPVRTSNPRKGTMGIDSVTRTSPMAQYKRTSESKISEVNTRGIERNKTILSKESKHNIINRRKKTQRSKKLNRKENITNICSTEFKPVKETRKRRERETTLQSTEETSQGMENDLHSNSNEKLIRLKKINRREHQSPTKNPATRMKKISSVMKVYKTHQSERSSQSSLRKGLRSKVARRRSNFKHQHLIDTSSGSCKEGCNFLPLMAKGIMGKSCERKEIKNSKAHRKPRRNQLQQSIEKGDKSCNKAEKRTTSPAAEQETDVKVSGKDITEKVKVPPLNTNTIPDASELDPQTKQLVISELLKVCDISQSTFDKMVRRKVPRPCIFAPKAILQRVNYMTTSNEQKEDLSNISDRVVKYDKSCTIM